MISVPMTVEACYMNKMEKAKIDKIAREVASANLHSASVVSVTTAPTTDSEGAPALTITITLTPGSTDSVSWPAPGSEDTELGVLMELEVGHGETEVYPRVQA